MTYAHSLSAYDCKGEGTIDENGNCVHTLDED